ncbi:uncharacterized protein FIBRA_00370 [Fibroporia radiculosa]|uniref:Uncharacterized protein n=1 Tax=Fibroporia radiculosa TaxID=599839 RepID=J7RVF9_9APHY|nr:uncharacterized protein FIBRA_00370 [Fibroporia radiculosa]CCL98375.1 predicted protein [Fibroporia radiculosa]
MSSATLYAAISYPSGHSMAHWALRLRERADGQVNDTIYQAAGSSGSLALDVREGVDPQSSLRFKERVLVSELDDKASRTAHVQRDPDLGFDNPEDATMAKTKVAKTLKPISNSFPSSTAYLPFVHGGSFWHGQYSWTNIVVFGDSYSMCTDPEDKGEDETWAHHLVRQMMQLPSSVTVRNFAVRGATVEEDLSDQISRYFVNFPRLRPGSSDNALDAAGTLYVFYLGINDCGRSSSDELQPIVESMFDAVHKLYVKAGARNFLFIDIPPIDRSPGAIDTACCDDMQECVDTWNAVLRDQADEFASGSALATVLVFSSHKVLTDVLDNPLEYEFTDDDVNGEGEIWQDELHLASAVHAILAERLLAALTTSSDMQATQ